MKKNKLRDLTYAEQEARARWPKKLQDDLLLVEMKIEGEQVFEEFGTVEELTVRFIREWRKHITDLTK